MFLGSKTNEQFYTIVYKRSSKDILFRQVQTQWLLVAIAWFIRLRLNWGYVELTYKD